MTQYLAYQFAGDSPSAASYMFGQLCYRSVFRPGEERPQFNIAYRWWEDEATTILWTFDVEVIKRVIRFKLFSDEQFPRMALHRRPTSTVDDLLKGLFDSQERVFYANLPHAQKVDAILQRCKPTAPPMISWGWLPARMEIGRTGDNMESLAVAKAIDAESHLHFTRITFEELVRYSLGYPSGQVEWFLRQHTCFYAHLLDHLHAFPEEVERYAEVEKHLRTRSPFAHRAVISALQDAGYALELPCTTPGFGFFAGAIQRLFNELLNLKLILKVLSVLGVRFARWYLHAQEMDWSRPFSIVFSFLEDMDSSDSPMNFARNLTRSVERDFALLIEGGTLDKTVANRLSERWHLLSVEVWECCKALPETIRFIHECLEPLLTLRNYHSLTAILSGLHKYRVSESSLVRLENGTTALNLNQLLPSEMLYLLNPSQNYALYRQQYQQAPGIPFLIPHLYEYHQLGEPILQNLYEQLSAVIPQL
ncbi:hypothetical protein BDV09DRAFT_164295 [Aspergillus tetrazonus]